jgi:hypothetical protein
MVVNRYGLNRHPREDVKREVRRRAGYGCLICGSAFGQYDHIDPEFANATEHNPDRIFYLCGLHHDLRGRGQLSPEAVRVAAANPCALQAGFSHGAFDMQTDKPVLHIGQSTGVNCREFLRVNGVTVLAVREPETAGGPFRLSANFTDRDGLPIVEIVDNEWRATTSAWDVKTEGRRIKVYSAERNADLVLRTAPPHEFFIEKMQMTSQGYTLRTQGKDFVILTPSGSTIAIYNFKANNCQVIFDI